MIEINLVPDVKQELIKAQSVRAKVITGSIFIAIISVGVVALLSFYIFAVQAVSSSLADKDIKTKSAELTGIDDLPKMLTIQNQLTKISSLNSNKKINSRLFGLMSVILPPAPNEILISSLSVNADTRTITMDGQAANSYTAVETFKKTLNGAKFKYTDASGTKQEIALASDIMTSNTSYGADSSGSKVLRFTLGFVYSPEVFSPDSKNISIVIKVNGNVTDSYLGVPRSIFTDRAIDISGGQ